MGDWQSEKGNTGKREKLPRFGQWWLESNDIRGGGEKQQQREREEARGEKGGEETAAKEREKGYEGEGKEGGVEGRERRERVYCVTVAQNDNTLRRNTEIEVRNIDEEEKEELQ